MSFSSKFIYKVWERYHGYANSAVDPFGYNITKDNFKIDHILPLSEGGSEDIRNLIPMAQESNQQKDDNLSGVINGREFEVAEHRIGLGTLYVDNKQVSK